MTSGVGGGAAEAAPERGGEGEREAPRDEVPTDLAHTDWEERFPGIVCGITTAFDADYGLSRGDAGSRRKAYTSLAARLGFGGVAVGRQVHGTDVRILDSEPDTGLLIAGEVDGLATASPGLLLAATAADCVPIHLYDPPARVLGLLHAGWRGTADHVLRSGIRAMCSLGADRESVHMHLGPAICGPCYEVDAPVLRALDLPGDRDHVDLRAILRDQAGKEGIAEDHISTSPWCTRCSDGLLHSHRGRGAAAGRMAAYLGRRGGSQERRDPAR